MAGLIILVVDDDEFLQRALRRQLHRHVVIGRSTRAGAVQAMAMPVDVVLADFSLAPGRGNGVEVLFAAQEHVPGALRVLMSGKVDPSELQEVVKTGIAQAFYHKPLPSDLPTRLEELLSQPR